MRTRKLQLGGAYSNRELPLSNYVSQFVGSNYNELKNLGDTLQERHYANKEKGDAALIALMQDRVLEGDRQKRNELARGVYGQLEDISKSDEGFENSTAAVSNIVKDLLTNEQRMKMLDNYKKAEEARQLKSKYGTAALNFGDDPSNFSSVYTDPNTGEEKLRDFNVAVEPIQDYSARMLQMLGNIADDGTFTTPTGVKLNLGTKLAPNEIQAIKTGNWRGVTRDKKNKIIEQILPFYKQTPEGIQHYKKLTNLDGVDDSTPIQIKDNKGNVRTTTQADETIRQMWQGLGENQVGGVSTANFTRYKGVEAPNPLLTPTTPGSTATNSSAKIVEPNKIYDKTYTEEHNGKYYQWVDKATNEPIPLSKYRDVVKGATGTVSFDIKSYKDFTSKYEQREVSPQEIETEIADRFNYLADNVPTEVLRRFGVNGYNNYKNALISAQETMKEVTPTGYTIAPQMADKYDDVVNRNLASTGLMVDGELMSLTEFSDKYGIDPSQVKVKVSNIHYDSPNRNISGYMDARVEPIKDTKLPANVSVPVFDQLAEISEPINHLLQNSLYQGTDTYTPETPYVPDPTKFPEFVSSDGTTQRVFYTITLPKKTNEQGKDYRFDTYIIPGDMYVNERGLPQFEYYRNSAMTPAQYREYMLSKTGSRLNTILLSGQTVSPKDRQDLFEGESSLNEE